MMRVSLLVLVALVSSAPRAFSGPITWEFHGNINSIPTSTVPPSPLIDNFALNTMAVVTVALESNQADVCPNPLHGCYALGPLTASFSNHRFDFVGLTLVVRDEDNAQDTFAIRGNAVSTLFGPAVNIDFELSGVDFTRTALSSDAMPLTAETILRFASRDTKLIFHVSPTFEVHATSIDSATTRVPEPSAALLAALASLMLIARRISADAKRAEYVMCDPTRSQLRP